MKLTSTSYDPLADIAVGEITKIVYGKFHNTMLPGKVIARVWNPLQFAKHAFLPYRMELYDPKRTKKAKEILKKAKRY